MSEPPGESDRDLAAQREVTKIALAGLDGFALAGSGAVREHGIVDRPTEDVDLFTDSLDVARFDVDNRPGHRSTPRERLHRRAGTERAAVRPALGDQP